MPLTPSERQAALRLNKLLPAGDRFFLNEKTGQLHLRGDGDVVRRTRERIAVLRKYTKLKAKQREKGMENFERFEQNPYWILYEKKVSEERRNSVGSPMWEIRASVARRYPHLSSAAWSRNASDAFTSAVEHHRREDASTIDEAYKKAARNLPAAAESVSLSRWR